MSLKHQDLTGTIIPRILVDEYMPKDRDEKNTIVVTFMSSDQQPANDLNTFIQRSYIEIFDSEASTVTDDDGNYLVFVEFPRTPDFIKTFRYLIKDIENVTGKQEWRVSTYLTNGETVDYRTDEFEAFIVTDPNKYVTKKEFERKSVHESIENLIEHTAASYELNGEYIRFFNSRYAITAKLTDGGDYDSVIGRNYLSESAFRLSDATFEVKVLESILENCTITPIDEYLLLSNESGDVVLLSNTVVSRY